MLWEECKKLISERLEINFMASNPYKLCDIKPAYGVVFSDYVKDYDFYGFGDIDVIYGDIRKFVTEDVLNNDCITFNNNRVNGHLCFFRNREENKQAFTTIPDWRQKMELSYYCGIDEKNHFFSIPSVFARESFNTPLSPFIPWMDGKLIFPYEWYWQNGMLTNNMDKDFEFLYLHFMRIKYIWNHRKINKIVSYETKNTSDSLKINTNGIFIGDFPMGAGKFRAGFDLKK